MRGLKRLAGLAPPAGMTWGWLAMGAMATLLFAYGARVQRQSAALAVRERTLAEGMKLLDRLMSNNDKREKLLAEMDRLVKERVRESRGACDSLEPPAEMAGERGISASALPEVASVGEPPTGFR